MENNLLSVACPKCSNSLLEAAIISPKYIVKAHCPFCSATVKWASLPLISIILGLSLLVSGTYSLFISSNLPQEMGAMLALSIGVGGALTFSGLVFLRFVDLGARKQTHRASGSYSQVQ